MKNLFLILFALCIFNDCLLAQQSTDKKKIPLEFTISAGLETNGFRNLNHRLKSQNLDKQNSFFVNAGFGIAYRINQILIGMHATSLKPFNDSDQTSSTYTKSYLSTNAIQYKNIILSPELGIGYQELHIQLTKKNISGSFDELLTTESNQITMNNKGTLLDFGIALKKNNQIKGINIPFLKLGYKHGFKAQEWYISGVKTNDGPTDKIGSFYCQLLFGIGR